MILPESLLLFLGGAELSLFASPLPRPLWPRDHCGSTVTIVISLFAAMILSATPRMAAVGSPQLQLARRKIGKGLPPVVEHSYQPRKMVHL
jgi:hypothetical protein